MRELFFRFLVFATIAALGFFAFTVLGSLSAVRLPKINSSIRWPASWSHTSAFGSTSNPFAPSRPLDPEKLSGVSNASTIDLHTEAELVDSSLSSAARKLTNMLVVAKLADDDNLWVDWELGDMIEPNGPLSTAIYIVNDNQAILHPPENKGHEAIVYLTYIIDFYEQLPDVSILMHGHGSAWHNNDLLNLSSSLMVRNLNLDKVRREGYMNLRCHWSPGCPDWLHPNEAEYDGNKQEQQLFGPAWKELFPSVPVPEVLSQPCCSQFAVTRERLLALPKQTYHHMRDWILRTDLADEDSGRIFEYCWQFMFHNTTSFCPDPRICYCDGYGMCFEEQQDWDDYFDVQDRYGSYLDDWWSWNDKSELYWKQRDPDRDSNEEVDPEEEWIEELPPPERGDEIMQIVDELERDMTRRKTIAMALGADPAKRAAIVEQTWRTIHEEGQG